jgi:hypothetical protein
MPYLDKNLQGEKVKEFNTFYGFVMDGGAFTEAEIAQADRLEVWCSAFSDPGEDWTKFKLFDATGHIVATRSSR